MVGERFSFVRHFLVACPILAFFLILEHAEVRLVARLADVVFFDSAAYGTTRLVAVGTVAVAAIGRGFEYFGKIVADLFFLHVEGAEALDARRVDEVAAAFEGKHFGEGGGVHALVVGGGDFACACCGFGQNGVEEGGLAHARIARQEGDAAAQFGLEEVDACALRGRYLEAGVADGGVEVDEAVQVVEVVFIVSIYLVEDELHGDAVGFGRGEEAVDEGGRRFGIVDGDDEHALVEVGSDDVRLLRQVGRPSDDVVLAVFDFADEGGTFLVENDLHVVAHSYRVGAADTLQAEVPFDFAFDTPSVFCLDEIPAACVLDDEPLH